jgi:hypothetical protein
MSGTERPDRLGPDHQVGVDDIRELVGGATPHFALQIRDRVARLIAGVPAGHPARAEGELAIARLEQLAREGQAGPLQEGELPLPSLRLGSEREKDPGTH